MSVGTGSGKRDVLKIIQNEAKLVPVVDAGELNGDGLGFPFTILGQCNGRFSFLSARGEFMEFSAVMLSKSENLLMLSVGGEEEGATALARIAPPPRTGRIVSFDARLLSEQIIEASASLPLFNPATEIRKSGVWRCKKLGIVTHCGDAILSVDSELSSGQFIGGRIYPSSASLGRPAAKVDKDFSVKALNDALRRSWEWKRRIDADIFLGFIGQALLGAFPKWRAHLYINGRRGSGKSTLLRVASTLLGPLAHPVSKNATEAGFRINANHTALTAIFDEQEATGRHGQSEKLLEVARQTSDEDGALIVRGTSDHGSRQFRLHGAFLMASIIPPVFSHADKSRWCTLEIKTHDLDCNLGDRARLLNFIEQESLSLAPALWRKAIDGAVCRFDPAFAHYSAIARDLGADLRISDTVAAIVSGWDLLHYKKACDPFFDEKAREMILPLIDEFRVFDDEGEGEQCLRCILSHPVPKNIGGIITVAELIMRNLEATALDREDGKLLERIGLRLFPDYNGKGPYLFIQSGNHSELNRALKDTKWVKGGHKAALMQLDGVSQLGTTKQRVAGRPESGVWLPEQHLPKAW